MVNRRFSIPIVIQIDCSKKQIHPETDKSNCRVDIWDIQKKAELYSN